MHEANYKIKLRPGQRGSDGAVRCSAVPGTRARVRAPPRGLRRRFRAAGGHLGWEDDGPMSRHRRDWSTVGILEPAPRDTEGRLQGSLGSKSHVNLELCGPHVVQGSAAF